LSVPETSSAEGIVAQPTIHKIPPVSFAFAMGLLVIINILWGASSAATKYGLNSFGPCTLAMLRFIPAGLLLFALCHKKQMLVPIRRSDRFPLFLLAFVGITLTYGVLYNGIARTTATDAALLVACEPLLIALMATLFLSERLRAVQWLGLFVGLAGVQIIAGSGSGNWIALLGLAFESSTSVIAKGLTGRYPGLLVVSYELLLGGLLLLPVAVWEVASHPPVITITSLAGWAYLTLVCTAICYGIWYWLLERFPISAMVVFILIQPLCGPLFGWLLRGEALQRNSALGGALVIVGIVLTTLLQKVNKTK